jgi:hypothetical protein
MENDEGMPPSLFCIGGALSRSRWNGPQPPAMTELAQWMNS